MKGMKWALPVGVAALLASCIKAEAPNAEADILTCTVPAELLRRVPLVENSSVTLMVKAGVDVTRQAPLFTVTEGAVLQPESGTVRDFTTPQTYTVTSEDKKWKKQYRVSFVTSDIPTHFSFEDTLVTSQNKGDYILFLETDNGRMEWASGNPGYRLCGVAQSAADYPTTQADGGVQGQCAKLVTRSTGSFGTMAGMPLAAGNLFIGTFNVSYALSDALRSTCFGMPFYQVPVSVTGFYKYRPGELFLSGGKEVPGITDQCGMYAMVFETDATTEALDGYFKKKGYTHPNLVALARLDGLPPTEQWTAFEMPFQRVAGKNIDAQKLREGKYSLSVVFSSSAEGDSFQGALGSTLWIDEVQIMTEE